MSRYLTYLEQISIGGKKIGEVKTTQMGKNEKVIEFIIIDWYNI